MACIDSPSLELIIMDFLSTKERIKAVLQIVTLSRYLQINQIKWLSTLRDLLLTLNREVFPHHPTKNVSNNARLEDKLSISLVRDLFDFTFDLPILSLFTFVLLDVELFHLFMHLVQD